MTPLKWGIVSLGKTGVDLHETLLFDYADSATATLTAALDRHLPNRVLVSGTRGHIELPKNWYEARSLTLWTEADGEQVLEFSFPGKGWHFEATHVNRCIASGRLSSDLFGPDQSLLLAQTTESLLGDWGISYQDAGAPRQA